MNCRSFILVFSIFIGVSCTHNNTHSNLPSSQQAKSNDHIIVTELTSVYDADSFTVNIAGWPDLIGRRIPIRVAGIDAPEMRGKCASEIKKARQAKQVAVSLLREAKEIELRNLERGKYFRILADVFVDGQNFGQKLITKQLARPYDGGKKSSWCQ